MNVDSIQTNFNFLVLSYENFRWSTNFPNMLMNNISNSDMTAKTATFVSQLNNSFTNFNSLQSAFLDVSTHDVTNFKNTDPLPSWLYAGNIDSAKFPYLGKYNISPGGFTGTVAALFSRSLPAIEPVSDSAYPQEYQIKMRAVFTTCFNILYCQIKDGYCSTTGSQCTQLSNIDFTTLTINIASVISNIETDCPTFMDGDMSNKTFLSNIFTRLKNLYTTNFIPALKLIHYNLIFLAYMPYFCFLYILYFLPTKTIVATNKAPRNGVIRGMAILATYKFVMYTLYGTYKLSSRYNPASSYTLLLRQALDAGIITNFHNQLDYFKNQMDSYIDHSDIAIANMASLTDVNTDIEMARSNVINISNNQKAYVTNVQKEVTEKWVWTGFIIAYLVAFLVIYFFLNKFAEYFSLGSLMLFLCIIIYAIVRVVKK